AELRIAPIVSVALEAHLESALKIALQLEHPIYDCLYLAVALHHNTNVVTADRRFFAAVERSAYAGRARLLGAEGYRALHEL
ncbi:MAG TPA: type II toxin-antitoxin system VapC family toxin, partial [Stellaceae bacterium]|nr:type II toxin-antitoxin system VapC family toxin [Stellaceae bacterium]